MNSYLQTGILVCKEGFINMPAKHINISSQVLQIMSLQRDCNMNLLKAKLIAEIHIYNIIIPVINLYEVCTNKHDNSKITNITIENVKVYVDMNSRNAQ